MTGASIVRRRGAPLVYAVVTIGFLLRTRPGRVGIDTKQYLYLDPADWVREATTMWQPEVAFGTVPHQNIGFLWPMGPFFWLGELVGFPDWVTQRLWLAGLLIAAGLGLRAFARDLGMGATGAWVAALVYAWSPYTLGYVHRTSVLLLPWAGLGFLLLFAGRAVRRGGWRDPAAFALVALTVGGANATAFLLAGLAPLLWVVHQGLDPAVGRARALAAAARIGVLTAGVSLWWAVALVVQGRYSLNVLLYSETIDAVARSTSAPEVLRGLGYWLFYGRDRLSEWIEPAPAYQTSTILLAVTFLVPLLGMLALLAVRSGYRSFCASCLLLGTIVAVGAFPWDAPSPLGSALRVLAEDTEFGLALRSSTRAVPLIALGLALPIGGLVSAVGRRSRPASLAGAGLVVLLAVAAFPPLWQGTLVAEDLSRPEVLPAHWTDAVAALDAEGPDTRIVELPGVDLAFHRWGTVWEPLVPGLTDRPYAARELIPYGAAGSVDLLRALDRRLQEGTIDPQAIAPVVRLLGAGSLLVRSDLEYERYRIARPRSVWAAVTDAPGLSAPTTFGDPVPNVAGPELPLLDEVELGTADGAAHPPPVAVFAVDDTRPLVHAASLDRALVVAGSGEGLVDAAAAGLLVDPSLVVYSASLTDRPDLRTELLDRGADLLVTDSNRRRAERWRTLHDNSGYTEAAGETADADDPSDARLPVFPDGTDDERSVAVTTGARATASAYGNPITYVPATRPQLAIDGDPRTAWEVGAFADPRGERLVIELDEARTLEQIVLTPADTPGRRIARLRVEADGVEVATVDLTGPVPHEVSLPGTDVRRLSLEIVETDPPAGAGGAAPSVGIAEVRIPGVEPDEAVRLPVDLLDAVDDDLDHRLVVLVTRQRHDPAEVVRRDEELALARIVHLPSARRFALQGTARLSARASDDVLWRLLGAAGPSTTASDSLPGDLGSRPWAALDGDPTTRWRPGFGPQQGRWWSTTLEAPLRFDHLDLELVDDGRHSVPSRLTVEVDGERHTVDVPVTVAGDEPSATDTVRVGFPPLEGRQIRITVDEVRATTTRDWYSLVDTTTPVGIAEIGIPGAPRTRLRDALDSGCRTDLLEVAGRAVGISLRGTVADASRDDGVSIRPCDGDGALDLGPGPVSIDAAAGIDTGLDLDQLALASDPGGVAPGDIVTDLGGEAPAADVTVTEQGDTELDVTVDNRGDDVLLVLGQNANDGWHAEADGVDLGDQVVVDGYSAAWLVPASNEPVEVSIRWRPQRIVDVAVGATAAVAALCLALVLVAARRPDPVEPPAPAALADTDPAPPRPWRPTLVLAAGAGLIALLVASPPAALVLAVAAVALGRLHRGSTIVAVAGLASTAAAFGLVVTGQRRHRWPADFDWPTHFERSHDLAILGVLLVVLAVAGRTRRSTSVPEPGDPAGRR